MFDVGWVTERSKRIEKVEVEKVSSERRAAGGLCNGDDSWVLGSKESDVGKAGSNRSAKNG